MYPTWHQAVIIALYKVLHGMWFINDRNASGLGHPPSLAYPHPIHLPIYLCWTIATSTSYSEFTAFQEQRATSLAVITPIHYDNWSNCLLH